MFHDVVLLLLLNNVILLNTTYLVFSTVHVMNETQLFYYINNAPDIFILSPKSLIFATYWCILLQELHLLADKGSVRIFASFC